MIMNHAFYTAQQRGFTLPVVLVSISGMLILLVGLLSTLSLERQTAKAVSDTYRAELIAQSGLIEIESRLAAATESENYVVTKFTADVAHDGETTPREYFMIGRPSTEATATGAYDWIPLYSNDGIGDVVATQPLRSAPKKPFLASDDDDKTSFALEPWQHDALASWQEVLSPETGEPIGRYAWVVEDMQGKLDAAIAGNSKSKDGLHSDDWLLKGAEAAAVPKVVPPDEEDSLVKAETPMSAARLHTLFDKGDEEKSRSAWQRELAELREKMERGGPLERYQDVFGHEQVRSVGEGQSMDRETDALGRHRLTDPDARVIEEEMTFFLQPYLERAVIPLAEGIESPMVGLEKVNLNALLAMQPKAAIDRFADQVSRALPDFESERKGGFPDDYLRTLGASVIDYADADSEPTTPSADIRGMDSYPLVNEFAMRFEWEDVATRNGRKFVVIEVETYVELWNMSNQVAAGDFTISYETSYRFPLGPIPEVNLGDPDILNDSAESQHDLVFTDGEFQFPQRSIVLQPNEIQLLNMGKVTYTFDVGPAASSFIPSPILLEGDEGESGYIARWNGEVIDSARGKIDRAAATIFYPTNTARNPRQKVRATVPGHSYGEFNNFSNNMGDPRMAHYIEEVQSGNGYPRNWSPGNRNIRLDLYDRSNGPKNIFSRVFPSEWPDGGHDEDYGKEHSVSDQRVEPDDTRFFIDSAPTTASKAPMFLSNAGRYYSATELGNIYDPIMWDSGAGTRNPEKWLDIDSSAQSSPMFGGGNTLRIGRVEHSRFRDEGTRASHLLDLFHAGYVSQADAESATGPLQRIEGQVNVNTASRDVLRSLLAGKIVVDEALARGRPGSIDRRTKAPRVLPFPDGLGSPTETEAADIIADEIILNRPYASVAETASLMKGALGIFGDKELWDNGEGTQWNDRAAETIFAKFHALSTVRSRNFKVTIVGQALDKAGNPSATHRRVYYVFLDPGERSEDGRIIPENVKLEILSEYAL